MQKNSTFDPQVFLRKYWFQLSIVCIVFYAFSSKDLSFQFNVNNPDQKENLHSPGKAQQGGSKEKNLITKNKSNPKIAKSEASLFSKIPFIGGGSSSAKKSELPNIDQGTVESYLKRFAHVAINERKKYGVPSSIILANAMHHSYAGKRDVALAGNNHFGIACSTDWNGGSATYAGTCYRQYENAWTSFRDHSLFVTSGKYAKLRQLSSTDYKAWANALDKEDFSEFDDLEGNLIKLIEQYGLHELDLK